MPIDSRLEIAFFGDQTAQPSQTSQLEIRRRQFLGAGVTLAASPVLPSIALAAAEDLHISPCRTGCLIRLGILSWEIDPAHFATKTRLKHRPGDIVHKLSLTNARLPGTNFRADFRARIELENGRWWIAIKFLHMPFERRIRLADWLSQPMRFTTALNTQTQKYVNRGLKNTGLSVIRSVRAVFEINATSSTWNYFVEGRRNSIPIRADVHGARFRARRLVLQVGDKCQTPGDISAVEDLVRENCENEIEGGVLHVSLDEPSIEIPELQLIDTRQGNGLSLRVSSISDVQYSLVGGRAKTRISLPRIQGHAKLTLLRSTGIATKRVDFWATGLALSRFAVITTIRSGTPLTQLFGIVEDRLHSVQTHRAICVVTGAGKDSRVVASMHRGEIESLRATANLSSAYIPFAGADVARLDFQDTILDLNFNESATLSTMGSGRFIQVGGQSAESPSEDTTAPPRPELEPEEEASPRAAVVVSSESPFLFVPLDTARFHIVRSDDLLKLTFAFCNVALRVSDKGAQLEEQLGHGRCSPDTLSPRLIVEFPPQHVAEKAYFRQLKGELGSNKLVQQLLEHCKLKGVKEGERPGSSTFRVTVDGTRKYQFRKPDGSFETNKPDQAEEKAKQARDSDLIRLKKLRAEGKTGPDGLVLAELFDPVVESRVSGSSRLVFDLSTQTAETSDSETTNTFPMDPPLPRPFSIQSLTDWNSLPLVVHDRALPEDANIQRQLTTVDIDQGLTRREIMGRIIKSAVPPSSSQTAIELPYRLLLSPSQSAKWITPRRDGNHIADEYHPLWYARLDPEQGGESVRAIWSPDFSDQFLLGEHPTEPRIFPNHPKHGNTAPWLDLKIDEPRDFRMSMDVRDRHEIVALTSIYGLPSLLRIPPRSDRDGVKERAEGSVVVPPHGFNIESPSNNGKPPQAGFFVPRPLDHAEMTLTSLGGFLESEGRWEPPAGIDNIWPAFTVERWRHKAVLGRDIFVEVVYKGFLYPIGHRASLVKVTERRFYPHVRYGYPTAYLIQRMFITVGKPNKAFPALGQVFQGRGWPATNVLMLTTRTPDIVDPFSTTPPLDGMLPNKFGKLLPLSQGAAFWPKTSTEEGAEVEFEYTLNEDDTPIRSHLLFVDNTATHSPKAMKEIAGYYNDTKKFEPNGIRLRLASHDNNKRKYAESQRAGDTEFETEQWVLLSKPRAFGLEALDDVPNIDSSAYSMDAAMEGADQPPFYPFIGKAKISAQSIAALTGDPTGSLVVKYEKNFLLNGFDASQDAPGNQDTIDKADGAKNPSEIYLEVAENPPTLDTSANGSSTGGIAKPNMRVAALSRSQGVVGGNPKFTPVKQKSEGAISLLDTTATSSGGRQVESGGFGNASKGTFDPSEFFGGALSEAKLLGLLSLKDVVSLGPFQISAPKLTESISYGIQQAEGDVADSAADQLKSLKKPARDAVEVVRVVLNEITETLDKSFKIPLPFNDSPAGNDKQLSWTELYPQLSTRIDGLDKALRDTSLMLKEESSATLPQIYAGFTRVVTAADALRDEISRLRKDPMPQIVSEEIEKFKALLTGIPGLLKAVGNSLVVGIRSQIEAQLTSGLRDVCQAASQTKREQLDYIFENLFGKPLLDPDTSKSIAQRCAYGAINLRELNSPNVGALRDSLLFDTLGEPLYRGYAALRRFENLKQDVLKTLADSLVDWLEASTDLGELVTVAETLKGDLLGQCREIVLPLTTTLIDSSEKIAIEVKKLDAQLEKIRKVDPQKIPEGTAHSTVVDLQAQVARVQLNLAASLLELSKIRKQTANVNFCAEINTTFSRSISQIYTLRGQALSELRSLSNEFVRAAVLLPDQPLAVNASATLEGTAALKLAIKEATTSILKLGISMTQLHDLVRNGSAGWDGLKTKLDTVKGKVKDIKRYHAQLESAAPANLINAANLITVNIRVKDTEVKLPLAMILNNQVPADIINNLQGIVLADIINSLVDPENVKRILIEIETFADAYERKLTGVLLQATLLGDELRADVESRALSFLRDIASFAIPIHAKTLEILDKLPNAATASDSPVIGLLKMLLREEWVNLLLERNVGVPPRNLLLRDIEFLEAIKSAPQLSVALNKSRELLERWDGKNQSGLVQTGELTKQIIETLTTGDLSKLIDLSKFEKQLKQAVLSFLPTQIALDYDWQTDLGPFPSGDPIFEMDSAAPRKSKRKDLTIIAAGSVDLLQGTRSFSVTGQMQPFQIKLFPGFEIVTIHFKGMRFTADDSGSDFDTKIRKVKIGKQLSYVEKLAKMLNPDTGPYVDLVLSPPSIIAGFRLNLGNFNLGALAFLNINLDISCELPLDNRSALFRFGLGSLQRPFMISAPPYGGGGFFMIKSRTDIVALGASFEFGGVVDITFGPLHAQGRVTTGIYIEKTSHKGTRVEGFVQAIGEGTLGCFSIAVGLGVRIIQERERMWGEAWFSFSFKMSFIEIEFTFQAEYEFSSGSGSDNGTEDALVLLNPPSAQGKSKQHLEPADTVRHRRLAAQGGTQLSGNCGDSQQLSLLKILKDVCEKNIPLKESDAVVVACTFDSEDWQPYLEQFDIDI